MKFPTQKSVTINGVRLTAASIRRAPQSESNGGHSIAATKAGEVHWMDFDGEVKIFNAGAMHRQQSFGTVALFLS